jgi:hypothetical protein
MNKKILYLFFLSVLILPSFVFAQLHSYGPDMSIETIIDNVVSNLWIVFAGIAVACFLVAGGQFLTANGAPEKLKTARSAFLWGVAGIVVGIISYSILTIVANFIS